MIALAAAALRLLASAAAPGCPPALAEAGALAADPELARAAPAIVSRLERGGAGGPSVAVSRAAWALADAAEAGAPDLAGPARAFRAALARHCHLAGLPQPPFASAGDRAALDAILARPEFRRARTDPLALRRLLLSAWTWILDQLGSAEAERWASLGRAIFLLAAAVAVAGAGVAWSRRRRRGRALPSPPSPAARAAAKADHALADADEALARGDLRSAVRHALLGALAALERAGRIPRGRALTNAELVRALGEGSAGAPLATGLAPITRRFDAAVYGGRATSPGEARAAVECARRLRSLAEGAR